MKKFLNTAYKREQTWHNAVFFGVVTVCLILCFVPAGNIESGYKYPMENVYTQYDQYALQFNAFLNGHTELDANPDERLEQLENPYDPAQRSGINYLWDIAYYNGSYYSYFGIAPILTVYYPIFILTGTIASKALVCLILGMTAVIFIALAYREVIFRFCREPNLLLSCAGLIAVMTASGVYVGILYSDTYYIAVLSALACSSAFIYLGFRAIRTPRLLPRAFLLVAAAIALTLTVWSRPTVTIMCLMILPLFIDFAAKIRKDTLKEGIVTIASFVLPLLIGAGAVMTYNAMRFSSPFDFGANWQLTVNYISKNKFDLALFFPALGSFFLQAPEPQKNFPFITWSLCRFAPFDDSVRYIYHEKTVGAFAFGLPIASLLAPVTVDFSKDKVKAATFLTVPLLSVFVAFTDYCLAGVNFRYLIDFLPILSAVSAALCLGLHEKATGKLRRAITVACLLLFGASVVMCLGVLSAGTSQAMLSMI